MLLPVGSCEQHGPHLPFDTDTRIAVAVATAVAGRRDDVLVAPPLSYGSSGEHQSFPGTLSMGTEALVHVLVELGRSAFPEDGSPHRSLVFVNGHGGNTAGVRTAVEQLKAEGRPVDAWWPALDAADAHAGRTETSLMLAIAPDVVGEARPVGATEPLTELIDAMREGGVRSVSENGVLGDATAASAADGRQLLQQLVESLDAAVTRLGRAP